jgi:pilus assembly protein CpaC
VTTLELKTGQTFAMAGLINRVTNARSSRVPGLGDLPVLGALFRSVRYNTEETELVVLVTASLADPQSLPIEDVPYPGMTFVPPSDWELYAQGRIQGKGSAKISPAHAERLRRLGLDQLNGPGAWASHERGRSAPESQGDRGGRAVTRPNEDGR